MKAQLTLISGDIHLVLYPKSTEEFYWLMKWEDEKLTIIKDEDVETQYKQYKRKQ